MTPSDPTGGQFLGNYRYYIGSPTAGYQAVVPNCIGCLIQPRDLLVADLDRNGYADVVVLEETFANSGLVGVYYSGPMGVPSFPQWFAYPPAFISNRDFVVVADLNEDGVEDFVFGGAHPLTWSASQGAMAYSAELTVSADTGGAAARPCAVDIDGDGHLDIVRAMSSGEIICYSGDGVGNFAAPTSLATHPAGIISLIVSDVDGDGFDDIITANGNQATWSLGSGPGTFASSSPLFFNVGISGLKLANVNLDAWPDIIVNTSAGLQVAASVGAGTYMGLQSAGVLSAQDFSIGDIDGDGDDDILTVESGTVSIYPNLGASPPQVLGAGCAGLTASAGPLRVGASWNVSLQGLPSSAPFGIFLFGSVAFASGLPLNASCSLYIFNNLGYVIEPNILGSSLHTINVPNNAALLGQQLNVQGAARSQSAQAWSIGPVLQFALSNGLSAVVGN